MSKTALQRISPQQRGLLFSAIRDRAVLRSSNQRLISPSGGKNSWLIDMRRIFMDAQMLDVIAEIFWQEFADKMPFQVGGMEVAAIPLLTAILMKSVARGMAVNGFIVRKERKAYGAGNLIEGEVTEQPIVIVDDIIGSGNSLEKIRVILDQMGKRISLIFVLIDYLRTRGKEWRQCHKIPVVSIFDLHEFGLTCDRENKQPPPPIFRKSWCFVSPDPNFFHLVPKSFPATDGKQIYFGTDSGFFWCLDALTGAIKWRFRVTSRGHKSIWSAPALHDGRVFFGGYDGNVYCLNASDGKEIWRYSEADWVGSSPTLAPDIGLLFIGLEFALEGRKGSIIALRIENGERMWEHSTKRYTHASPAYWPARRLVACGSNDDEMFMFEALTGRMLWRFQTKAENVKGSIRHAPAFDTERTRLVTGCADGNIYIIDVETGQEIWSVKTDNSIYSVPLIVGNFAYLGSTDKHMYILDLEKKRIQTKLYVGSKIYAPPAFLNGKVYFGGCNGMLYEIDPETSSLTGTHQLPDAMTNRMAYSSETNLFYALTYVNQLYALAHL